MKFASSESNVPSSPSDTRATPPARALVSSLGIHAFQCDNILRAQHCEVVLRLKCIAAVQMPTAGTELICMCPSRGPSPHVWGRDGDSMTNRMGKM
jgi:hypothetical protein